jgi:hypothetical protein
MELSVSKLGVRVIGKENVDGRNLKECKGTIKHVSKYRYAVEFDNLPGGLNGHDCGGTCNQFRGWNCTPESLDELFTDWDID